MAIDRFVLPRADWYDTEGRIYKDALIENFNAIEAKLLEIQKLDPFNIQEVDWSTVSIPDVTLSSSDNKVVNLNSLISIMKLNSGLPITANVEGKTIKRLEWYYNNTYHSLANKTLTIGNGQFVKLDLTDGTLTVVDASDVEDVQADERIIGGFTGGKMFLSFIPRLIDYDVLGNLANMKQVGIPFTNQLGKNSQKVNRDRIAGRRLGATWINKNAGTMRFADGATYIVMPDSGYEPDGSR